MNRNDVCKSSKLIIKKNSFVRETYTCRQFYGWHNHLLQQLIRQTIDTFCSILTFIDFAHPVRQRTVRTQENIAVIEANPPPCPTNESLSINYMENFALRSWFIGIQNQTRARIKARRSSFTS